jgi:hypothetical protein
MSGLLWLFCPVAEVAANAANSIETAALILVCVIETLAYLFPL